MTGLTKEQFKEALPEQLRSRVQDDHIENINAVLMDPMLRENFRDNLIGFSGIMMQGKYKLQHYIDAVKFVSYKLLGDTNVEAYRKTFPDRWARLIQEKTADSTVASFAANYNNNQLVNKIYEQTLVPIHVLNADVYQKAINQQCILMMSAKSEKVRSDAANSILHHLKRPETQKIDLDISLKEDQSIAALRESTMALVAQQRDMIKANLISAKEVAESRIIDAEFTAG